MILTVQQAHDLARAAMVGVGHSEEEAKIIADHLIDCELRVLSFGGLPRALSIAERIQQVGLSSRRPISVVRDSPISATIDGGDQVGYLVAHRATSLAIEKAKATGIAIVGAHATWYTGMFSYYLERVTRAGFAGIGFSSLAPASAGRFGRP
jgi:LDH2 family malate/lactate/ureidoglycolate dehydrogenase